MTTAWRCTDQNGETLFQENLAGHLAMVSQYQGTICTVKSAEYVRRLIAGEQSALFKESEETVKILELQIIKMMRELNPDDFELLVETVFVNTGWARVGKSGGNEYLIDLQLSRPALNERGDEIVAVQIKSKTTQKEFEDYERRMSSTYKNVFYVYHTGDIQRFPDSQVKLISAEELSPLVLKAGLLDWLRERIR
jgi:hypothetical protein